MNSLWDATQQALTLLLSGDTALWKIVGISFSVSLRAILFTTPLALVCAFLLAYVRFPGRQLVLSLFNTLLSVPVVVIGLTLYLLLSRSGPLGDLHLLFTQSAMITGQVLICFPLLVVLCHAAISAADRAAWETALTLGASVPRALITVLYEVRFGLLAAVISGFGRIVGEVGSSMMVGGNILNFTRNIPTAIALETSKGTFAEGIALGIVLLTLAFALNLGLSLTQRREAVK
jgi:tungstate transport system permease protein